MISRFTNVLRLRPGDDLILFDEQNNAHAVLESASKKEASFSIQDSTANKQIEPAIRIALPLLKKDAFAEAIYNITELGGTEIQLLDTEKAQRSWGGDKEMERLKRITIAAAEQSKNFAMPTILPPISLEQLLQQEGSFLFCDVHGKSISELVQIGPTTIIIGPEGDLSDSEKDLLNKHNVEFYRLTPTILRSVQAVTLALGYLRC
jgi:16S rRNA (uracil1498-N3)-methyltransferase